MYLHIFPTVQQMQPAHNICAHVDKLIAGESVQMLCIHNCLGLGSHMGIAISA